MSDIPNELKYAASHEWIKLEDGIGTVGITDHAQEELSDVVYVELPEIGTSVAAQSAIAVVESVKAASDIYSPVSGEIIEINEGLNEDPSLINQSPYEGGWIYKVKVEKPEEIDELKSPEDYKALTN
ncbi:MAG: glycine cleavage system protein GcvH [Verrucomicrobiota bacterium]